MNKHTWWRQRNKQSLQTCNRRKFPSFTSEKCVFISSMLQQWRDNQSTGDVFINQFNGTDSHKEPQVTFHTWWISYITCVIAHEFMSMQIITYKWCADNYAWKDKWVTERRRLLRRITLMTSLTLTLLRLMVCYTSTWEVKPSQEIFIIPQRGNFLSTSRNT